MMALSAVEQAWIDASRTALTHAIYRVSPSRASPNGLRGWLEVSLRAAFETGKLDHRALLWDGWRVRMPAATLGTRFIRAGLRAPHEYVMAMRIAAIGAVLSQGADVRGVEIVLRLSSRPALYRSITNAERRNGRTVRTASVLAAMRSESPTFAFERYVVPLLPTAQARWTHTLFAGR